jgi:hypothetical protein
MFVSKGPIVAGQTPFCEWGPRFLRPWILGLPLLLSLNRSLDSRIGLSAGFFFLAAKYDGIDFAWCINGGNHPHLLF